MTSGRHPAPIRWRVAAVGVLLGAFALRVHLLDQADIWWDEALAVWAVRKPVLETTSWTAGDVHPPLFFWQVWGWIRLVGESALGVRAVVALTGTIAVALTGLLASALVRPAGVPAAGSGPGSRAAATAGARDAPHEAPYDARRAGYLASLLAMACAGLSRFAVWWSMELRMYMLAAVAVMVATWALVRWWQAIVQGRPALPWLLAYALAGSAVLHTVYLAGVALAFLNLPIFAAVVAGRVHRRAAVRWAAAQVAVLVSFVPWGSYAFGEMSSWSVVTEPPSLAFAGRLWATLLATGVSTDIVAGWPPTLAFWGLVLGLPLAWTVWRWRGAARSAPSGRRSSDRSTVWHAGVPWTMLAMFLVATPVVIWAVTQPRSIFYSPRIEARYFVPFAFPVYGLIGALLARLPRPFALGLAVGGLLVAGWQLPDHYETRRRTTDLPAMSLAIWSQAEPGDVVVLVSGNRDPLFRYHYERAWVQPWGRPAYEWPSPGGPPGTERAPFRPQVVPFPDKGGQTLAAHPDWRTRLERLMADQDRIWLVEFGRSLQDPDDAVEAHLAESWPRVLSEGYGPDALHLFAADGTPPRLTHLSSSWPGTMWIGGDATAPTGTDPLPVAGAVPSRAMAGDGIEWVRFHGFMPTFGSPLARLAAPGAPPVTPLLDELIVASTGRRPDDDGRAVGRAEGGAGGTGRRERVRLPIDDRTPGGLLTWQGAANGREAPTGDDGSDGRHEVLADRRVRILGARPVLERRTRRISIGFEAVTLHGFAVSDARVSPGDALDVDLYWSNNMEPYPSDDLAVFVHLVGPPGQDGDPVWAGQDGPPSSGRWTYDRHHLVVDPAAPPGDYLLELGVYVPSTGERYPPRMNPNADPLPPGVRIDPESRRVILGSVEVSRGR